MVNEFRKEVLAFIRTLLGATLVVTYAVMIATYTVTAPAQNQKLNDILLGLFMMGAVLMFLWYIHATRLYSEKEE